MRWQGSTCVDDLLSTPTVLSRPWKFSRRLWVENVAELIRQVKAFQHVRATGEATPSGWQPGKKTLKPGVGLVGHVWEIWKPEMAFDSN